MRSIICRKKGIAGVSCLLGIFSLIPSADADNLKLAERQTLPYRQTVIYVDPVAGKDQPTSYTPNTAATALHSITYALKQAAPGTTIQLAPGNYSSENGEVFPLTVKQGVTIKGDESNNGQRVVISGGNYYLSPTFGQQNVTVVAEKDSAITGVTVSNLEKNGTGVWIESANPRIKHSTFSNNYKTGIFVAGTSAPLIEANIFTQNQAEGLLLTNSAQGQVKNNLFEKNNQFGLSIVGTSSPVVIGNKITENKDGVQLSLSASPVLQNNIISSNQGSGIVLATFSEDQPNSVSTTSFRSNVFRNNGQQDIDWSSD